MYIFKEKESLQKFLLKNQSNDSSLGYIPTMGALHEGHLRLMKEARLQNEVTLVSIFVNPTQFNEKKDLENYPIQVEEDIQKLIEADVTALYLPDVQQVYPEGTDNLELYDFGKLETILEGAYRAGHFQGVGQVLSRFLKLINPDRMYMGQKDYQQLLITRKLVNLLGLRVEIIGVPTKREKDGLAMSSRNALLSDEGRDKAKAIAESMQRIEEHKRTGFFKDAQTEALAYLEQLGFQVEYLSLAKADTLEPEQKFRDTKQVLLIAAWLEGVRLIDNILL